MKLMLLVQGPHFEWQGLGLGLGGLFLKNHGKLVTNIKQKESSTLRVFAKDYSGDNEENRLEGEKSGSRKIRDEGKTGNAGCLLLLSMLPEALGILGVRRAGERFEIYSVPGFNLESLSMSSC